MRPEHTPPAAAEPAHRRALAYDPEERHPLVQAFVEQFLPDGFDPDPAIAAGDEMLGFSFNEQYQHRGLALVAYLRSGWLGFETLEQALAWRFGALERTGSLLDMAGGFGRVTRFLRCRLPASAISVAEINREALEFQRQRFGVTTIPSGPEPHDLACERSFRCVNAFSLFTHLPERSFRPWLARLWELVEDDGLLLFSTNGPGIAPAGRTITPDTFFYERVSEIAALSLDEYGSTWVGERYVENAISDLCPGASSITRVDRALWSCQDLYAVTRGPAPPAPLAIHPEPLAFLDTAYLAADDELRVSGWAMDRESGAPVEITVSVNGEAIGRCIADRERRDIAERFGDDALQSGWFCELGPGPERTRFSPTDTLSITARGASGRTALVHLSLLEGADLKARAAGSLEEIRAESLQLREVIVGLEREIAAMKQSRFWKLRDLWWRLTGRG